MMIDEKLTKIFARFHAEVRNLLSSHSREVGAYLAKQFVVHASKPRAVAKAAKRGPRTCKQCGSAQHDIRFHKKKAGRKMKTAVLEIAKAA